MEILNEVTSNSFSFCANSLNQFVFINLNSLPIFFFFWTDICDSQHLLETG